MKPCTFSIFCKHPQHHENAVEDIRSRLTQFGFIRDDEKPEIILVLGGDGSLLKAFHDYSFQGKYIMLNTGHLGFFSDYSSKDYPQLIEDILTKDYQIEEMPLMELKLGNQKHFFVSDLALQSERTILLSLDVNDAHLTEIRCNGIVVGTNSGSTGYLLSLGGPIMIHSNNNYQYQVIAPVYNRIFPNPINRAVLSKEDELKIHLNSGESRYLLDGIPYGNLKDTVLSLRLIDQSVKMIHFKAIDPIRRIRRAITGTKED